jgi:hypothetical protein
MKINPVYVAIAVFVVVVAFVGLVLRLGQS